MTWPAAIAVGLALLLYLRSPIDLLPDRLGAVGLLDDLLLAVAATWWVWSRLARAPAARALLREGTQEATGDVEWDPYAVLGVARGASPEDITRAYREQMRLYHPDRVAHLGDELRQLSHRKALAIQRAYTEIGRP